MVMAVKGAAVQGWESATGNKWSVACVAGDTVLANWSDEVLYNTVRLLLAGRRDGWNAVTALQSPTGRMKHAATVHAFCAQAFSASGHKNVQEDVRIACASTASCSTAYGA